MEQWIGSSGFQYPEWKGIFYPEKMAPGRMLSFYAEHFSTTEVNYSFRRIPSRQTILNWAAATPEHFKFSFKAPQKVTHFARLRDSADVMDYFSGVVGVLGPKLGPVLFQLPPDFEKDVPRLEFFLETLPKRISAAFEFRNPSWFDDEVFTALESHNAALCVAESEKISTPKIVTADFGYLRLRREDYLEDDLDNWADFIRRHLSRWSEAFIYFKHEEKAVGPKYAQQMQQALALQVAR
jgi:uncharacterized protein YecE (DUF72 family)